MGAALVGPNRGPCSLVHFTCPPACQLLLRTLAPLQACHADSVVHDHRHVGLFLAMCILMGMSIGPNRPGLAEDRCMSCKLLCVRPVGWTAGAAGTVLVTGMPHPDLQ